MHKGNYEPKVALVEPGVWPERARRKGATATGELRARPALYKREQQPEWERERHNERRGDSAASRSSRAVSHSLLFICEVRRHISIRVKEESKYIRLRRLRKTRPERWTL
jgi:hypothetical protein